MHTFLFKISKNSPVKQGEILMLLLLALKELHSSGVVEKPLSHAERLGRDLEKLVIGKKLEHLLKAENARRDKTQGIVTARGTHVGKLLFLAYVYHYVISL